MCVPSLCSESAAPGLDKRKAVFLFCVQWCLSLLFLVVAIGGGGSEQHNMVDQEESLTSS